MARSKLDTLAPELPEIDQAALADVAQAQTALSVRTQQINELYGDGLPYDRDIVIAEVRMHLDHSAKAMLEAGKCLILIKENESSAEYHACLERIGIAHKTAQKFMQVAVKYTQRLPEAKAEKLVALGRTKLLELMVIDDGELEALADGGTVAGLVLDDVERMSTSELREALRAEKQARKDDAEIKDRMLSDRNAKIDQLASELARADIPSHDDTQARQIAHERALMDELQLSAFKILDDIHGLAQAVSNVLADHPTESQMTAAETTVQWLFQRLNEVAMEHSIPVNFAEIVTPSWAREYMALSVVGSQEH